MKPTLATILAGFATLVASIPVSSQGNSLTVTMERGEFNKSQLNKRGEYDGNIVDSVNYILVVLKDDEVVDAYQDEVDAVQDPADVLG
jgi:hypothetical protein